MSNRVGRFGAVELRFYEGSYASVCNFTTVATFAQLPFGGHTQFAKADYRHPARQL